MNIKLYNDVVQALINASNDVFQTMISMEITALSPFDRKGIDALSDITGVISLTGDLMGSVILSMESNTARQAVSNMLGDEINNQQEVIDGVGEITNMIVGMAKTELSNISMDFEISVPFMIIGKGTNIKHLDESEKSLTTIPFKTAEDSIFQLELYLKDEKN